MIKYSHMLHGCSLERATMAFTTSASVPTIYIQPFWNTLTYVEKARTYRFQLDESWFTLDANLLKDALEITPIDPAHQFVSPPSGEAIMDFVNQLGYTEVIHFVSRMAVNNLYQPLRAILSMINQCITGKTSGHDRPRYPVLQMLWGIITCTNVDFAELMWEEFVQAIQFFLTDKANLGSPTKKGRKDKPHVIPYCQFTKLIICHLGRIHNVHQRPASSFHLAEQDLRLGNLKFVSKGKADEVFGMPIPNELISNNIRNAPYYSAYMEMVAKHDQKVAAKKEGKKKTASTKQPKPKPAIEKSSKPVPAPKPKVTKEKPFKASTAKPPKPKPAKEKSTTVTPLQKAGKGKVAKVHDVLYLNPNSNGKMGVFSLRDWHDFVGDYNQFKTLYREYDLAHLKLVFEFSIYNVWKSVQYGVSKELDTAYWAFLGLVAELDEEPAQHEPEPEPEHQGEGKEFDMERAIQMSLELFQAQIVEGKGKAIVTEEQAAQSLLALHTPKRRSTMDHFMLQRRTPTNEEASTGPSAQPLDDTSANIVRDSSSPADAETGARSDKTSSGGDTEAGSDPGKTHESQPLPEQEHMDEDQAGPDPGISRVALSGQDPKPTHDEFMADLIWRDQFINDKSTDDELSKLNVEAEVVSMVTVLIYQASSSVPPLSTPVIDLSPPKPASSATQALIFIATTTTTTTILLPPLQHQSTTKSEVFTLELRDLPYKIDEGVRENVKEVVQIALQAPLIEHFRDLPEADMEEMLHQRMFETDPPPPPPDLDLSKRRRHNTVASGSLQPPAPQSSTWKKFDTRDAPSSFSKQQSGPHAEQPVDDIPIPDSANICDSEDTDSAHLPKSKQRLEWLKPIPNDERPATPEPAWVIPLSHIPDAENN
ncbi:hypothetical protein Tco_0445691 [Tanacetum coccineum]